MGTILQADGLVKTFSTRTLFHDVSFKVNEGDRIGIIGVNGAGKTTLFRMLTGKEEYDSGYLTKEKGLTIAYMEQYSEFTSGQTAYEEVLTQFAPLLDKEAELEQVNALLETSQEESLIRRQHALLESFEREGGLTFRGRVRSTLLGLGLTETEISLPMMSLSGGQRTRVLLAKILMSGAKLLLLDEPTNHLDIPSIAWLEDFLSEYRGSVIVVSHDRFFLDRVTNRTFELEHERVTVYDGNYSYYKEKKAFDRVTLEREYEKKQKEIARIEGIIAQQKHFGQERNYVTIRSKQKQIDRIAADLVKPEDDPESIGFSFKAEGGTGNEVLKMEDLAMSFEDKPLFRNVTQTLYREQHAFLVGPNGCGKTTLLKIVLGQLSPDGGHSEFGARVKVGYYDQTIGDLHDEKTVFEEVSDAYPKLGNTAVRTALGAFLFRGDDVFKQISVLSGGERARVALTKLMLSGANLLILDEPTNHLDIPSKEALEDALLSYDGTLLAVSHDRYFINRLADRIFELTHEGMTSVTGNYDDYLAFCARRAPRETVAEARVETSAVSGRENEYVKKKAEQAAARKKQARLSRIESEIASNEEKMEALSALFSDPSVASDYARVAEITAELDKLREATEALYSEWDALSE
ncbi:MAG: ABC-F family ATP-binding cassette domain-containing protein [Clostridia bacterium]|nr:ABC-F family ATP-binding cassette domain-containing protein [Clostridia bacterium]